MSAAQPIFTAFAGNRMVASGPLEGVVRTLKAIMREEPTEPVLVFDDATGRVVDLDLRGEPAEIAGRQQAGSAGEGMKRADGAGGKPGPQGAGARGRGRPKLGVVAREVTLLPRHWDWLAAQPGGASQVLRRLVDEARRADGGKAAQRQAQEAAYKFMSAIAGDYPGFEEAARALFAGDAAAFARNMKGWPADVVAHARKLAALALPD